MMGVAGVARRATPVNCGTLREPQPPRRRRSRHAPGRLPKMAIAYLSVEIDGTFIEDTFAEAFGMRYVRLVVTAADEYWLEAALRELTGYSSSVIACDAEAGV